MAAAIPNIEFTNNNRGGLDIRCENYIFQVNPLIPPQQLYEQERSKVNTNALLAGVEAPILPDYLDRKGRFIRHRNKDVNKNASSLIELIVPEVKTK